MPGPVPVLLMSRELGSGGCERDLTRFAKAADRSRFQPHVGCFRIGGLRFDELKSAGIPLVCFSVQSLIGMSGIAGSMRMRSYLRHNRIGLVHCFDAPTGVFAAPVTLSLRVPLVASNLWFRNTTLARLQHASRFVDRVADAIMVNSDAVRQDLLRGRKFLAKKTRLCYNGVDTAIFKPETKQRPSFLTDASLVIGSVCALRAEKRLDKLVTAFAQVRDVLPGLKLLIVGSGEMLASLTALREKLGLEQDCIFEPAAKDVAEWMSIMDIFVLPSDTESFPNVLLEAMACGRAVLGSRVGGIPELIEENQSGLLFDRDRPQSLADALTLLIQDPALRNRIGQAAAARARDCFSLERSVRCIESMYEEIVATKGRRSRP